MLPFSKCIPDVIAFGNVLLDMTVEIDSTDILDHYKLSLDAQGEISSEILAEIRAKLGNRSKIVFNPGGSALNTCRILRKLNSVNVLFSGAVGQDENASILQDELKKQGVPVRFQVTDDSPTGQCICFVYGDKTGLYANIGASQKFSKKFLLDKATDFNSLLQSEKVQIVYIEGFFIPKRFEVCQYIVTTYISENRKLGINLNAVYIVEENFEEIKYLAEFASFIFGNRKEFNALANLTGIDSVEGLAQDLLSKGRKVLVVTNGAEKVCMYTNFFSKYSYEEIQAKSIPQEDIVDTTGAGDAFVAGFLNAFLNKMSLVDCLVAGCDIASVVVTQVGCNLP